MTVSILAVPSVTKLPPAADGAVVVGGSHGAVYAASSGRCLGGPCAGRPLVRLQVEERDGRIYYLGVDDG